MRFQELAHSLNQLQCGLDDEIFIYESDLNKVFTVESLHMEKDGVTVVVKVVL